MNKLFIKDLKWYLIKENPIVNFIYFSVYKFYGIPEKPIGKVDQDKGFLTKKMLKENPEFFKPKSFLYVKGFTSGSTNSPLKVFRSFFNVLYEEYTIKSFLFKIGISVTPKIAIIRGDHLFDFDKTTPPFWKKMPFSGRLLMSSFHLSNQNIIQYLKALEDFKPELIMAYPSSITAISKIAIQQGWFPSWNLKAVFCSSESFPKENQDIVRVVFPNLYDHYGQAERVAALQQCSFGMYHVREDYSIVEFKEDQFGIKIIGTSVRNKAMPLIRYDTGDYVEGIGTEICKCGSKSRYVSKIIGRDDDNIILENGRFFGRFSVVFRNISNLIECQIIQDSIDHLTIKYVPESMSLREDVGHNILKAIREIIGHDVKIDLMALDSIERSPSGKFKSVINKMENK